ncbi:SDR family NAD(P)-dependent oxidoreductase [Dactylosporangium sp. NPDC050688]|uniref:SDR family NAD(P)-dependent oxidoreductase n=1 Tax=Dactylosporangium sp. NPDC050688 TaxID=3157217 RepID=UPI0033E1BB53
MADTFTTSTTSTADTGGPVGDWFAVPAWQDEPAPAPVPVGRCLAFTGDGLAARLTDRLRSSGAGLVAVVPGPAYGIDAAGRYTVRPGERADVEKLLADLAVSGGMPSRVVLAWPLLGEPAGLDVAAAWQAQQLGLFAALALAQALGSSQLLEPVHLDVITAGTEDLDGTGLSRPEHATLAGIVRVLPLEMPDLSVRQLDLDPAEGDAAIEACLAELTRAAAGGAGDQVVLRGGRRLRRDYRAVSVPAPADPADGLRRGGVYVITGGLGGIGLAMAEDLARRAGAKLVLFGRTGAGSGPDASVRRIEAAGGEVLVLTADVTDEADLARVRQAARHRFGRIDGILHAAGVAGGGTVAVQERAAIERVLAPKLAGTLALARVFGADDLDIVVFFGSTTAVAAQPGQLDACAAHAFCDAVARSGHGFRGRVLAIDWGGWLDTGMAVAGAAPDRPVGHPLLDRRHSDGSLSGALAPATHWVLDQHRVGGVPMLPATAHLELMHRAVLELTSPPAPDAAVELRDVSFVRPFAVPPDAGAPGVRVTLTPAATGWDVRVFGPAGLHASATADWVRPGPPPRHDLGAIQARCAPAPPAPKLAADEELLIVGPDWPVATQIRVDAEEQTARIELADPPPGDYWLHPALLDRAVGFPQLDGAGWLPVGYGSLLARAPLPGMVHGHVRYTSRGDELISADVTVTDADGVELVAVTDLLLRRVPVAPSAWASWAQTATSPTGEEGIRPAAGLDAFARLLATDLGPQVVATPESLPGLLAQVRAASRVPGAGPVPPPEDLEQRLLDGQYVAPRTELEGALAAVWSRVLGVGQIGVTDDFFELGGDSLLGVQLAAAIRAEVGVKVPMRTLFDLPSIERLAVRIEQLQGFLSSADPGATPAGSTSTSDSVADEPIPRLARP